MFYADDELTARDVATEDRDYWSDRYDFDADEDDEP